MTNKAVTTKSLIMQRTKQAANNTVWTPIDFIDIGSRLVIDKTLQRMVISQELRRIGRGLYDKPQINALTGKLAAPDYWKIIEAVARRDQVRMLIDGLTCANEL